MTKDEGIATAPEGRGEAHHATARSLQLLVVGQLDKGLIAMERAAAMVADVDLPHDSRDQRRKMRALKKRFDSLRQLMDEIALAVVDLGMGAEAASAVQHPQDQRPRLKLVSTCDTVPRRGRRSPPALHLCPDPDDQDPDDQDRA